VERERVPVRGQDLTLTVSVGVVGIDAIGTYSSARTDGEVLALAEAALRLAVGSGGNRVEAEGPLTLP
jgi:GGDEF domain-containing protein